MLPSKCQSICVLFVAIIFICLMLPQDKAMSPVRIYANRASCLNDRHLKMYTLLSSTPSLLPLAQKRNITLE